MTEEFANLFDPDSVFYLSQDDKARVPLGLPISKKQTAIVMHVEYKVYLILCLISVAMKLKNYKLSFHFPHLTKVLYLVMRVKIFNNILYLILSR